MTRRTSRVMKTSCNRCLKLRMLTIRQREQLLENRGVTIFESESKLRKSASSGTLLRFTGRIYLARSFGQRLLLGGRVLNICQLRFDTNVIDGVWV